MRKTGWLAALAALLYATAGAAGQQGTVTAADGLEIAYDVRGEGDPALVFVHCWTCNRAFWREQLDVFAEDHTVVALDLPGHGASGRERETWTMAAFADDVRRVVEALELERVVLVGHSMGGPVSVLAAGAMPERTAGVICSDTLHDAEMVWPEEMRQGFVQGFTEDYEGAMAGAVASMTLQEGALREWLTQQMLRADRGMALAMIDELGTFRLDEAFEAVEAPVRCINAVPYAEHVVDTAVETNRRYADFDAAMMEGVGHFPHLEKPAEFNAHMREFLQEMAD